MKGSWRVFLSPAWINVPRSAKVSGLLLTEGHSHLPKHVKPQFVRPLLASTTITQVLKQSNPVLLISATSNLYMMK